MGSTGSITFEDLEARTYSALWRTTRVQLAFLRARLHVVAFPTAVFLATSLRFRVLKFLTTENFEKLSDDEAHKTVELITTLHSGLNRLLTRLDKLGIPSKTGYRTLVRDIRESTEKIGNVLESYILSLNPDFRELVTGAMDQLKPSREPSDWRSSLAEVQD